MAQVVMQQSRRDNSALKAIFSPASIRPPLKKRKFDHNAKHEIANINDKMRLKSYAVLGIGDANSYIYGRSTKNGVYDTQFNNCDPMGTVDEPDEDDRLDQDSRMTSIITTVNLEHCVPVWCARVGNPLVKRAFAAVIDAAISDFVVWSYASTYSSEVASHLQFWVRNVLAPHIRQFLILIESGRVVRLAPPATDAEIHKWQEMALTRLATLRVDELFDIVVDWPHTKSGIDDLRLSIGSMASRAYITDRFSNSLQARLLHPGASTTEIVQFYIAMIRAFRHLDPRGVLLQRSDRNLRRYLRERDDTIKIVVAGLLSDPEIVDLTANGGHEQETVLRDLAHELQQRDTLADRGSHGFKGDDLEWQPEPLDAAPEYKLSKITDVVNSVISLFESKDVFIRELQTALAERLLLTKLHYDQETSVIEHLKIRFGDSALQACEVMLRDVLDSRKLDNIIRSDQGLTDSNEGSEGPALHAKILSRLFWPSLPGLVSEERPFKPPVPILHQRALYEKGFEALKQTRKLTWNDNLGQVSISLSFDDERTFNDEVLPYQAAVIYAFNDDDLTAIGPVSRSIADLADELSLSPTLVRSACLFFVSKQVLTIDTKSRDTFIVLEHLPSESTTAIDTQTHKRTASVDHTAETIAGAQAAAAAARQAEMAAVQAQREAEAEERGAQSKVYQQFVLSMLTNQGQMPLARMAMMLGIVVPGGLPFNNEELKEFLDALIKDGKIELLPNGNYKIVS